MSFSIQARDLRFRAWWLLALSAVASPALAQSTPNATAADVEPTAREEEPASSTQPAANEASSAPSTSASPTSQPVAPTASTAPVEAPAAPEAEEEAPKSRWDLGFKGYFRAPMALGISSRPHPDNLMGKPQTQISYGPNRTVDANYYSFAYTRLQEQD